jgi:fructokinase
VGLNLVGGEWGTTRSRGPPTTSAPAPRATAAGRGCIESFLSGPGLERDHAAHAGLAMAAREIADAARRGDADALATMARYHDRLARGLATIVNVVDPDVIVLGGGLSNVPGVAEAAGAGLARYVFSDTVVTPVVRNRHGDASGVRGAAWLWPGGAGAPPG